MIRSLVDNDPPVLKAKGLSKRFGRGCPHCFECTGPDFETNVCCECGSVVACHDINFELYAQDVLGIVGESGSGKSTLVRLCHFDWDATGGQLFLGPKAIDWMDAISPDKFSIEQNLIAQDAYTKRQVRQSLMGIVYQHPHLGLRMGISSSGNIAERLLMTGQRNVGQMRERAAQLFERTEVPLSRMDEAPRHFSGGMQQRVQIAKALSNNPMILLLDEVTTGLDVSVQARVLDLIRMLQQEFKVATIVVSHDLGVIRLLTSRTMVMRSGRIVEHGLTDQVLEDPQHPYTQLLVNSEL